jgi:hypothetical protein
MTKERIMKRSGLWIAAVAVCGLVLGGGCAKQANLSLKFTPNEKATYTAATETIKDYKFEQPSINQTKVQQTLNRTEIMYDQQIQSVDPSGDAKALITIKEIKYLSKSPKGMVLDFDSTKEADKKNALENLVGQSYVIKISPSGQVAAVEDVQKARDAVKGDSMEQKIGQALLSDDAIKQRHTIIALPDMKNSTASVGKTWSRVKASPSGMLTPKSYEEVYTLKSIEDKHGQQIAEVDMAARPSAVKAPEMSKEEAKGLGFFEKMFDNKEAYTGKMMMDISSGQVLSYNEKLKSEWVAVEPAEEVKSDKGPDVLTMGFTYSCNIEKVK